MSEKAASVSVVNCVQFAFLWFANVCFSLWEDDLSLVLVLCVRLCGCIMLWRLL